MICEQIAEEPLKHHLMRNKTKTRKQKIESDIVKQQNNSGR